VDWGGEGVEKKAYISRRPYLSFNEVFDEYEGCTAEDLFHDAAIGNLTIYIQIPGKWKVGLLSSVKRDYIRLLQTQLRGEKIDKESLLDLVKVIPAFKNIKNKADFIEVCNKGALWLNPSTLNESSDENQEIIHDGVLSYYQYSGKYQSCYDAPITGRFPLSSMTIASYSRAGDADISLKLHEIFDFNINSDEEFFIYPETGIYIKQALKDNNLCVLKEDWQRLLDQPADPEDAKPEGAVSRKSLLKLVIGMATEQYSYDPTAKKNKALSDISADLATAGVGMGDDSIREALKEASKLLLPLKPA
jgi:hypothetical protein